MQRAGRAVAVPQDPAEREHAAERGPGLAVPSAGRRPVRVPARPSSPGVRGRRR